MTLILLLSQLLDVYGVDDSIEKCEVADVPGKHSFICKTSAVILDPSISGTIVEYNWFAWLTPLFILFLFSCLTSTVFTDWSPPWLVFLQCNLVVGSNPWYWIVSSWKSFELSDGWNIAFLSSLCFSLSFLTLKLLMALALSLDINFLWRM